MPDLWLLAPRHAALVLTEASASIGPQASGWTGHSVSPSKVLLFSAGYMFGTITLPRPPSVDAPLLSDSDSVGLGVVGERWGTGEAETLPTKTLSY